MTIQIPKSRQPLTWPANVPRTKWPEQSNFHKLKVSTRTLPTGAVIKDSRKMPHENSEAYKQLAGQINRIVGVSTILISSNLDINEKTGFCYYDGPSKPGNDAGVAAYWTRYETRRGQRELVPYCMPCDKWNRIADNLYALALSIEALRGMDRWGCVSVEQAFSGFAALPPGSGEQVGVEPAAPIDWRIELAEGKSWPESLHGDDMLAIVRARYRRLMVAAHPDHPGGSQELATRINAALEAAEKELGA